MREVKPVRDLILVLGDQLWMGHPALCELDAEQDAVVMIEAASESTEVWSHRARIALFLSAMRHFCNAIHARGWRYEYVRLDDALPPLFAERLAHCLRTLRPQRLRICEPGEWRMLQLIQETAAKAGVLLDVLPDTHFMCSREAFARWAGEKRELRMEFFYREMRKKHGVLMDGDEPEGGRWNLDDENRKGFPKSGPGEIAPHARFEPDAITQEVLALVAREFPQHPGSLDAFAWPVTREQALTALDRFIEARLEQFGPWQDAMWKDLPFGWHSLLSTSLNLHLLDPREVIAKAEAAYRARALPLASVEGFIRQILGWREFIRGVYWLDMPQMREANHYAHRNALPNWYWTGETKMQCMRQVIGQTLRYGYAHHIQRLMITGQFGVLAQLQPQALSDWYLAVYVDAIEWVELPNVSGMALYANGGRLSSKPYVASGQYVKRMSNYCNGCAYRPEVRTGPTACPMTALYWRFLDDHAETFARNPRTIFMAKNVQRLSADERAAIRAHSQTLLDNLNAV